MKTWRIILLSAALCGLFTAVNPVHAQGTAFTYQGQLQDGGGPANGIYNFAFTLYTNSSGGTPVAGPAVTNGVSVINGAFTVQIDFGAGPWNGQTNWLELAVEAGAANTFTTLAPRQQVTPTPYAIFAATASNLSGTLSIAQLPCSVVTNNGTNVILGGLTVTNLGATNLTVGGTNQIAPLTVPPVVPISPVGTVQTAGLPYCVAVAGRYAYVVNVANNTMQIIDVSNPANPAIIGTVQVSETPLFVAVAGRYAYTVSGINFQVIDVGNPANPVVVGSTGNGGYQVAICGHYAYVATGAELQVIDVANPAHPVVVGLGAGSGQTSLYNVAVAGRYAYATTLLQSGSSAFQVFDIGNPTNPIPTGSFTFNNEVSAGESYTVMAGRYAYTTAFNSLYVIDVSNPANPIQVGSAQDSHIDFPTAVAVAGRYVVMTDIGSLYILDVSDPTNPVALGSLAIDTSSRSVAISGRYAYVVSLGNNSLQIFDLGGAYIQPLEAGTIETGTLQTRDSATIGNDLNVRGGLTVGSSAHITGGLSVNDLTGGLTTNIVVTVPTGTMTLYFTNGVLRAAQ